MSCERRQPSGMAHHLTQFDLLFSLSVCPLPLCSAPNSPLQCLFRHLLCPVEMCVCVQFRRFDSLKKTNLSFRVCSRMRIGQATMRFLCRRLWHCFSSNETHACAGLLTTIVFSRTAHFLFFRRILVRLVSTANTGYFYSTMRNKITPKLEMVKFDPIGERNAKQDDWLTVLS